MRSPVEVADGLPFVPTIRSGLSLLSPKEVRRAIWLIVATLIESFVDVLSVAAVLPFVNVVVQPEAINTNRFMQRFYEWSGTASTSRFISLVGFGVIVLMVLGAAGNWCLLYLENRYAALCQNRLAKDLLDRCMRAPYSWFLTRNSLMLSRLVYDDVVFWSRGLIQRLIMMVNQVFVVAMAVVLVLTFSVGTGILAATTAGLVGYTAFALTRPVLMRLAATKRAAMDTMTLTANEALAGIKDIKLKSREAYFSDLFRAANATVTGAHAGLNVWQETPLLVMGLLAQLTFVALALLFWNMGLESGQIATQIALLVVVTTKVVPTVGRLSVSVSGLLSSLPHVKVIQDMLSSIEAETQRVVRQEGRGKLVDNWRWTGFERVGYRYPDSSTWALREVTIVLERNGSYGIVGPSAAGKSTLVDLLVGLLAPVEGVVCVDEDSLEKLDLKSWQRRIGYVPQMPFLVDASLRANVAFGVSLNGVDDDRVIECLRLANLADLPAGLEHGLDTRLGERGLRISGGQRQRIAIARALYNRPEILVLDEAMSALDTITEGEILTALGNLRGQVTLVVIAHRLSTVVPCDQIFVLENGRLVGQGTYAELQRNHELFQRMAAVRV